MATNDFVPVATGVGANVPLQSAYLANPNLPIGQQPGVASSSFNNKALRQATYIAACLAQFLSNSTGNNVLDDGNMSEVLATMAQTWTTPTGIILPYGGSVAPTGYLLANGALVSRTAHANLFAVLGTAFGAGDGVTTFGLPNMARAVPMGAGGTGTSVLGNTVGSTGGEETHTLVTGEMPVHNHGVTDPGHQHYRNTRNELETTIDTTNSGGSTYQTGVFLQHNDTLTQIADTGVSIQNTGGGTAHNNMQPSVVVNYIIKT